MSIAEGPPNTSETLKAFATQAFESGMLQHWPWPPGRGAGCKEVGEIVKSWAFLSFGSIIIIIIQPRNEAKCNKAGRQPGNKRDGGASPNDSWQPGFSLSQVKKHRLLKAASK